jgi:hypothetical protein
MLCAVGPRPFEFTWTELVFSPTAAKEAKTIKRTIDSQQQQQAAYKKKNE